MDVLRIVEEQMRADDEITAIELQKILLTKDFFGIKGKIRLDF